MTSNNSRRCCVLSRPVHHHDYPPGKRAKHLTWTLSDRTSMAGPLGVTRRVGERRFLLMGQAMLKLHELGGHKFPPVGFFSAGSSEEDKDWLPMPVESNGLPSDGGRFARSNSNCFVRDAMSDFGLRPDGEAGTSVVIPHPMDELTDPANLAYAVIRQYFHPIIAGDLVVEITSPTEPERTINASTIADEARRTGNRATDDPEQRAEALVRVIALAKWGRQQSNGLVVADGRRTKPAIAADKVEMLRGRYQDGERLAFRGRCSTGGKDSRRTCGKTGGDPTGRAFRPLPRECRRAARTRTRRAATASCSTGKQDPDSGQASAGRVRIDACQPSRLVRRSVRGAHGLRCCPRYDQDSVLPVRERAQGGMPRFLAP